MKIKKILQSFISLCMLFICFIISSPNVWAKATPNFPFVIVPNYISQDVSIVDTRINLEINRIPLPSNPYRAVMSRDAQYAYIATQNNRINKINIVNFAIPPLDLGIPFNNFFSEMEISPNDRYIIAIESPGVGAPGAPVSHVSYVIDTTTNVVVMNHTFTNLGPHLSVDFSQDNRFAFINDGAQTYMLDLLTMSFINTFPSSGFAVIPDIKVKNNTHEFYAIDSCGNTYCLMNCNYLTGACQNIAQQPPIFASDYFEITFLQNGLMAFGGGNVFHLDVYNSVTSQINLIPFPGTSVDNVLYNSRNNQVWARETGAHHIEIFDINQMSHVQSIQNAGVLSGVSAFSRDGMSYYAADIQGTSILAVDTSTYTVQPISVGLGPIGVFRQGDNSVHARY